MTTAKIVFDGPSLYKNHTHYNFYSDGCSPTILHSLISYLRNNASIIQEVYGCLYLFNNRVLHEELKKLSSDYGVKISIVSIPLEGYDDKSPQKIIDLITREPLFAQPKTKFDLAAEMYQEFLLAGFPKNYKLYVFPHMYLRSSRVNAFSRGAMPYSLHAKSFYIKFKDGSGNVALTSSNLAVRDQVKSEILVIASDFKREEDKTAAKFFDDLIRNSIDYSKFNPQGNYFDYQIAIEQVGPLFGNFYIAPFYDDSPNRAETYLARLLSTAKRRIYISAQHICSYQYTFPNEYHSGKPGFTRQAGILQSVLDARLRGVDIHLLSQTFVDELGDSHGCRRPSNVSQFQAFIGRCKQLGIKNYAANDCVHWKFIVVDNTVVITTCNFTPTQFIYLPQVDIPRFDNIPGIQYKGVFAEVGQYLVIRDEEIAESLIAQFRAVRNSPDTYCLE